MSRRSLSLSECGNGGLATANPFLSITNGIAYHKPYLKCTIQYIDPFMSEDKKNCMGLNLIEVSRIALKMGFDCCNTVFVYRNRFPKSSTQQIAVILENSSRMCPSEGSEKGAFLEVPG